MVSLAVQQVVPQLAVAGFDTPILPGAAGLDTRCPGNDAGDPALYRLGHELGAMIGADGGRHATGDEQASQNIDNRGGLVSCYEPPRVRRRLVSLSQVAMAAGLR